MLIYDSQKLFCLHNLLSKQKKQRSCNLCKAIHASLTVDFLNINNYFKWKNLWYLSTFFNPLPPSYDRNYHRGKCLQLWTAPKIWNTLFSQSRSFLIVIFSVIWGLTVSDRGSILFYQESVLSIWGSILLHVCHAMWRKSQNRMEKFRLDSKTDPNRADTYRHHLNHIKTVIVENPVMALFFCKKYLCCVFINFGCFTLL